jgi:tRNA-dihydrouridine synthase B
MGNPWIFESLRREVAAGGSASATSPEPPVPSVAERRALILRHGVEMFRLHGPRGIREMRKHLAWYSRGIRGGAAFRSELAAVVDLSSFEAVVERFF